ncbi:MAG: hypothetical protein KH418_01720 [Veillonella sp.]|nr:hypothetical protein [Veillonella sp.]
MSIYNWIQEKLFDDYEEWRLKCPDYNRNGFNIVGIDNTLKAMHDGFFMYIELYPPHAIDGCTAKSFMTKAKLRSMEELEDSWWNLYEKLASKGYAVELSCKCELEDFIYYVQKLIRNKSLDTSEGLIIDTAALDEDQCIMDWCADLNSKWENYTLAGMDIGTDSFVLMVLSNEEFKTAQELAKELLHRIDVAERL